MQFGTIDNAIWIIGSIHFEMIERNGMSQRLKFTNHGNTLGNG